MTTAWTCPKCKRLVVKSNARRLAIHLSRQVDLRLFVEIVSDRKKVTHVAKLHDMEEFKAMKAFLREAMSTQSHQRAADPIAHGTSADPEGTLFPITLTTEAYEDECECKVLHQGLGREAL